VIENNHLKIRNRELEENVRALQLKIARISQGVNHMSAKRVLIPTTALLSVAVLGFLSFPSLSPYDKGVTDIVSFPEFHSPIGRKLMSVSEMDSPEFLPENYRTTEFWLDDVLQDLRRNDGFTAVLKLVQNGPIEMRKMIQRKLYEEFKISFRELRYFTNSAQSFYSDSDAPLEVLAYKTIFFKPQRPFLNFLKILERTK
jgi:hypothetical protein